MEPALAYLISLLDKGIEWPDAVWKACEKYDIRNNKYLENLYDDYVAGRV